MDPKPATSFPDYTRPPVIEVVYGIQFDHLEKLQAPLTGVFWQKIRKEYPEIEEMPPLAPVVEQYKEKLGLGQLRVQMQLRESPPLPRIFFIHKTGNWVMQLQNNKFLYNWRKVKEDDIYPRFPIVSAKFFEAWESFREFCKEEELSEPKINQLELTYINHIPFGDKWNELAEIGKIFPDLGWRDSHKFLPSPESINWTVTFLLPDNQGRLRVSLRHGVRDVDNREVLLCELTVRGSPPQVESANIRSWFALGREWIVRGFTDLTSDQAQTKVWGRKA